MCSLITFSNANTEDTIQYTNYSKYGTIVNGVVVGKYCFIGLNKFSVFTCIRFKVLDVFKGKKVVSGDTINIIYLGGDMPDGNSSDGFVNLEYLEKGRQCILPLNDSLKYYDEVDEKDFSPKGYYIWHGEGIGLLQTKNSIGGYFGGYLKTLDDVLRVLINDNVNGISKIQLETPFLEPSKNDIDRKILPNLDSNGVKKKDYSKINKTINDIFQLREKQFASKIKNQGGSNVRTLSNNILSLELKNPTSIRYNNEFYTSVDVYISSSSDVYLEFVNIFLSYHSDVYGSNVVANPKSDIIVTKSNEFSSTNYLDVGVLDYSSDIFQITLATNTTVNEGIGRRMIGSIPIKLVNIKIKTEWSKKDEFCGFDFERLKVDDGDVMRTTIRSSGFLINDGSIFTEPFFEFTAANGKQNFSGVYKAITPVILSFSPKIISAGNGKILTINGYNFGNTRQSDYYQVQFRSTKNGGVTFIDGEENLVDLLGDEAYVYWSDNEIKVKIPSEVKESTKAKIRALPHYAEYLNTPNASLDYTPGSGHFFVQTDPKLSRTNYDFCRDHTYEYLLDIEYAVDNLFIQSKDKVFTLYRLPNSKEKSGIVFRPGPNLSKNVEAMNVTARAIKDINCIGAANITFDSDNVINPDKTGTFNDYAIELTADLSLFPSEFTLGTTNVGGTIICPNLPNSPARKFSYVYINSNRVADYSLSTVGNSYNLYEVITHELGHVLGLNHCNELNEVIFQNVSPSKVGKTSTRVMYFASQELDKNYSIIPVTENTFKNGITETSGLNTSIKWSEALCSGVDIDYKLGVGQQCVAPPSAVLKEIFESSFNFYPNPTRGEIHVTSQYKFNIDRIEIINAQGVLIRYTEDINEIIDIEDFAKGMYILKVETSIGTYVKKIMLVE